MDQQERENRSFHLLIFLGADSYFSPPVHLSECWAQAFLHIPNLPSCPFYFTIVFGKLQTYKNIQNNTVNPHVFSTKLYHISCSFLFYLCGQFQILTCMRITFKTGPCQKTNFWVQLLSKNIHIHTCVCVHKMNCKKSSKMQIASDERCSVNAMSISVRCPFQQ